MTQSVRIACACVFLFVSLPNAVDLSGVWRDEFKGPDGKPAVQILELAVHDKSATGMFTNALGAKRAIRDGSWDGMTLRFWIPWDTADSDKCQVVGALSGDTLVLDLKTGRWRQKRTFRKGSEQ